MRSVIKNDPGTAAGSFRYFDMTELADSIRDEIASIERQMEDQKHLLRRAADNQVVFDAAETELKALHTRLTVLKGNLRKYSASAASEKS